MTDSLIARIVAGDVRAVARAISKVEDGAPDSGAILKEIFPSTGRGLTIGITGAPGSGKSSLVDRIALNYIGRGEGSSKVGIVAVDPSSPFSGGAILGDRIRMQALATHPKIFIRSMATRGNLGGLARGTIDAVSILDAAGYHRILVETVGVGQDEVDIVRAADISVVVLVPGMGDDIQAIKAGIMEIGDIFVINKSEREGVERTERELIALLEMSQRSDGWSPPVIRTVATQGRGIDELVEAIENYAAFRRTQPASAARRTGIARQRLLEILRERVMRRIIGESVTQERFESFANAISARERDPYAIVDEILAGIGFDRLPVSNASEPKRLEGGNEGNEERGADAMAETTIQHVGVAVASIDEALRFWREGLGLELREIELVEDQGVRVALLPVGGSRIELLEATGSESPVGRFIAKRGAGIHHLCLEVDDLPATLLRLKNEGLRLIDEEPRIGAGGALVAFVHPAATGGVLLELTQRNSARPG